MEREVETQIQVTKKVSTKKKTQRAENKELNGPI